MSALKEASEQLKQQLSSFTQRLRQLLFGVNNERLDFLMDSFYKKSPQERVIWIGSSIALICSVVAAVVYFYFVRVEALKEELSASFSALHQLRTLKAEDQLESQKIETLIESIEKKTQGLAMKPFFERLSKDLGVTLSNLTEEKIELDSNNPLSKQVTQVRVLMKMQKISIPRLLKFLIEIEKSSKFLRVSDVKITGLFENKLYFDANLMVRGYVIRR